LNEFKVGLLTLASILSLAIIALKITANQSGFGSYLTYRAIVNDATGVYPRTAIRVAGINAGRIKSIELEGSNALIEFEVLKEIVLTENSQLKIKTIGFLGEKYLDLFVGDPVGEKLNEFDYIKVYSGGGMEDLAKDASEILFDVKGIVKKIKESLQNDKSDNLVRDIVANVNEATASIRRITQKNEEKINEIIDHVKKLTQQLAYETDGKAKDSLMQDLKKIGPILDDVKSSSADLKVIMADVRAGKGTVGKLLREEEVVDQVSETLSSVNKLVGRINDIEAEIALFTGGNNEYGNHTQFDIDIYPAPERFFRIGVVSNEFGPDVIDKTETTQSVNDGSNPTVTYKEEKDIGALKFNAQIGRRIQRFGVRVGLIESEAGVGLDYFLTDYSGLKFTLEGFDFSRNAGTNLRFTTELRLWNILYTRVSGEDLLSGDKSYTISAGLRFTDEDLAALIGYFASR
jgi:phospholipid/cholesterol/gamma-HCH transport system substrate-binding protein